MARNARRLQSSARWLILQSSDLALSCSGEKFCLKKFWIYRDLDQQRD